MSPWPEVAFGDLVSDETGGNAKTLQSDYLSEGAYPIVDQGQELIGGYTNDGSRVCKAELPVIVFGDHTKCFKYIDFPFCLGADGTKILKPKRSLDERYLFYALQRIHIPDAGYSRHFKYLKEGKIPLPPLEEQKRIAAILDQADELRRKRQRALDRLNQLGQAIFIKMFGTSDKVRSIPLGEIADLKRGPFGGALKKEIFVPTGYKVYEQGNAIKRTCDVGTYFIDRDKYSEMQAFAVAPNDLIVSCSGTIGRTYLIPEGAPPGIINQALLRVRVNESLASPKYLEVVFASSAMQDFLTGFSRGTGLQNFPPMSEVRSIPVPMPSVTDQTEFLQRLQVIEAAHQKASCAEEAHEALFASLQHRAFRGELSASSLKEAAA